MKFTLPASIILAILYVVNNPAANLVTNISNIFFVIGLSHIFLGLVMVVKSGGLFKSLNYFLYKNFIHKRRYAGDTDDPDLEKPMTLYEFTQERYGKGISFNKFLYIGIGGFLVASLLAFLV